MKNRNRYKVIVLFFAACAGFIFVFPVWPDAVLADISGKVEVQLPGQQWSRAQKGMTLPLQTMISTGFSSTASLDLGTSIIHLQEFTRMLVKDLLQKGDVITTDLELGVGKIRAQVESAEGLTHDFNILSTVSVASVRGTDFEYDGESLYCFKGEVLYFNMLRQKRTVRTGEEVRLARRKRLAENEPPLSPEETLAEDTVVRARPSPGGPDIPADEPEIILPGTEIIGGSSVGGSSDSDVTVTIGWPE